MNRKNINVSVLVQNTHASNNRYYGSPRDVMVNAPIPDNIIFISGCIHAARDGFRETSDPTLGTIIVLPEFILQPDEGAYTNAQRVILEQHLTNILATLPNDVLVIFGTVVSESDPVGEFYNDMLYGIGQGVLKHTGKLHLSKIDLFEDNSLPSLIGWDANHILKRKQLAQLWDQSPGANHIINFKGKRIGFSICLDYYLNELSNRLGDGNAPVDLHIVSSCGMEFVPDQTGIYKDTAKVIICDAYGNWSSVHQVNKYGQSKQQTMFSTSDYEVAGKVTKIRKLQITVPD